MNFTKEHARKVYITLTLLIVVLLIVLVGLFYSRRQPTDSTQEDQTAQSQQSQESAQETDTGNKQNKRLGRKEKAQLDEQVHATRSDADINTLIKEFPKDPNQEAAELILINKDNPFEQEPQVPLAYDAESGQSFHEDIEKPVTELLNAAQEAGYPLYIVSGYRSIAYQEQNIENNYQQYLAQTGGDEEEAQRLTDAYVAPANASEHTTGLVLDLLGKDWMAQGQSLSEDYENDPSAQWLMENAADYGFILRYPKDKEDITGYNYEPWHYRYVGVKAAQYMAKHGLALEEFHRIQEALAEE